MIKVAIADDHQLFIDGVKLLLKEAQDIRLVGESQNGIDIDNVIRETKPTVVLLDINMPGRSGLETAKSLRSEYQELKILMLTMNSSLEVITTFTTIGADGYILKDASKADLINAIRTVAAGGKYYSQQVTETLVQGMMNSQREPQKEEPEVELTSREKDVIRLILQQMTTSEIASKLFIAESTVITHRKNLLRKTGSRNTVGLVQYAMQKGWDSPEA